MHSMLKDFAVKVKKEIIFDLRELKKRNVCVSISSDEWTALKNRCYMSLNAHLPGPKVIGVGMKRITGSMPAESAVIMITETLASFELNLHRDVVGFVSDGAAVMKKTV